MCVLSIKMPIRKKSGNLFNDPRIYIYIYIHVYTLSDKSIQPLLVIFDSHPKSVIFNETS